ncbi:MAG: HAD family hydrolase, partial [Anaerolineae bacterium]|nr:HAD family hydrolase [Anaerolineae bacterium]
YARAAVELCPGTLDEAQVIAAFKDVVGLSRREVALALMERFNLEGRARERMAEFGVSAPWQVYIQLRLRIYEAMLTDPDIIRNNQWPHNVALLRQARALGCHTGLATMSYCPQVARVLDILELNTAFDFVASRDDVTHGKPDPEIYQLVAHELKVQPQHCLVIEDSPTGVQAALAAGMPVIAVSTPFTREGLRHVNGLDSCWIVDDPSQLMDTVQAAFHTF